MCCTMWCLRSRSLLPEMWHFILDRKFLYFRHRTAECHIQSDVDYEIAYKHLTNFTIFWYLFVPQYKLYISVRLIHIVTLCLCHIPYIPLYRKYKITNVKLTDPFSPHLRLFYVNIILTSGWPLATEYFATLVFL